MSNSNLETAPAADPATEASTSSEAAPLKTGLRVRVKRLEKPDREAIDKEISELNKKIEENNARIQEIKDILESKHQGRQAVSKELLDARNKLADVQSQFRSTLEQKKAIREQINLSDDARKRMRDEANSLRSKLPFVKVEHIDEELVKLEHKMAHSSLSLNEEKKVMQQIRDLTKSRDFVKDYHERMDRISADEGNRSALLQKMKEKDELINSIKAQETEQKAVIDGIRSKLDVQSADRPALSQEKQDKFDEIKALRDKIRELRSAFKAKEDEFWAREREWRAQQQEDRKRQYEEREKRRKEMSELRRAREAENFVEPYTEEIILCDQLVSYLKGLGVADVDALNAKKPEAVAAAPAPVAAPAGFGQLLVSKKKKGNEELDSWFGGMGGGKGAKGKGKKAPGSNKSVKIVHSLDSLASFDKVKVPVPMSATDVLSTLTKVQEQKKEFEKLQMAEKEKREKEKEEAEKAAVDAAVAGALSSGEAQEVEKEPVGEEGPGEAPAADPESAETASPAEFEADIKGEEGADGVSVPESSDGGVVIESSAGDATVLESVE